MLFVIIKLSNDIMQRESDVLSQVSRKGQQGKR